MSGSEKERSEREEELIEPFDVVDPTPGRPGPNPDIPMVIRPHEGPSETPGKPPRPRPPGGPR